MATTAEADRPSHDPTPHFQPEVTTGWPVHGLLRRRAELQPDRVALNVDERATLTYGEWNRRSDARARGLAAAGLAMGDVVGLVFDDLDWIDYAVAHMGVLKAGATAVHLNRTVGEQETLRRLTVVGAGLVVRGEGSRAPDGFNGRVTTVAAATDTDDAPFERTVEPEFLSDILFTSATTGLAKAITTPHGNLTYRRGPEGFHLSLIHISEPTRRS